METILFAADICAMVVLVFWSMRNERATDKANKLEK